MNKHLRIFLVILFSFTVQVAVSHEGHDHDNHTMNAVDAQMTGLRTAKMFAEVDAGLGFGKLPQSWSELTISAAKLHDSGAGYYIVAIANETENKTLYVLMSSAGDVFDANFTGQFPKLKS